MYTPSSPPFTCANCEIVISGAPTIHVGLAFCCAGCVAAGPCICSYDGAGDSAPGFAPEAAAIDPRQVRECLDVTAVAGSTLPERELALTRR